jgi:hypothetical protein
MKFTLLRPLMLIGLLAGGTALSLDRTSRAWTYRQATDPLSKLTSVSATAMLWDNSLPQAGVQATFSCGGSGPADAKLDLVVLDRSDPAKDAPSGIPLASRNIQYRFNGVVKGDYFRETTYKNAATIDLERFAPTDDSPVPGLKWHHKTVNGSNAYVFDKFQIVNSEFVVRLKTAVGEVTLQMSLTEPEIKQVLMKCGISY